MSISPSNKNSESKPDTALAKNLSLLMKSHGITDAQLAKTLNLPYNTIKRLTTGETSDPRYSTLRLIADYFDISIDLITEKNNENILTKKNSAKPKLIPILNWDSVSEHDGRGNLYIDEATEWTSISYDCPKQAYHNIFALRSRPSMSPRFHNDSLLIINPIERPTDGDTILVKNRQDNSVSLKELVVDSPTWLLHPIVLGSEILKFDPDEYQIIGVVVLTLLYKK